MMLAHEQGRTKTQSPEQQCKIGYQTAEAKDKHKDMETIYIYVKVNWILFEKLLTP